STHVTHLQPPPFALHLFNKNPEYALFTCVEFRRVLFRSTASTRPTSRRGARTARRRRSNLRPFRCVPMPPRGAVDLRVALDRYELGRASRSGTVEVLVFVEHCLQRTLHTWAVDGVIRVTA